MAIERRQRRRRNGEEYVVWRVRWTNEAGVKRATTFQTERDALDFEARLRLLRRSNDLVSLDAERESLAEFAEEWWRLDASSRLERATLKGRVCPVFCVWCVVTRARCRDAVAD